MKVKRKVTYCVNRGVWVVNPVISLMKQFSAKGGFEHTDLLGRDLQGTA